MNNLSQKKKYVIANYINIKLNLLNIIFIILSFVYYLTFAPIYNVILKFYLIKSNFIKVNLAIV